MIFYKIRTNFKVEALCFVKAEVVAVHFDGVACVYVLTEREAYKWIVVVGLFIRICVYLCILRKSKRPLICWASCKALFVEIQVFFLHKFNVGCHESNSYLFAKVNSFMQVFLCLVIKTYTAVITRWYISL